MTGLRLGGKYYPVLACAALALAAFNLTVHLGQEFVTEWDESLYAHSALEMMRSGDWIGVTFLGTLDYYNTKPPLNVWLLVLSFKAFGPGIVTLRLASVISAWLTVAVLQVWLRRAAGPAIALLSSVVLATTFGFLHVHAGRSANTDALFTLLILLVVVTLWAEEDRPWRRVWIGPLLAAVFLLRGPAVMMPLAIVAAVDLWRGGWRRAKMLASAVAAVLFLAPAAAWAIARYRVDQWQFLDRVFGFDFVARTVSVLDEHAGGPFYYVDILQKHHYDWLLVAVAGALLFPVPWSRIRASLGRWAGNERLTLLMTVWAVVAWIMPTIMRTKLPWYLNPFYPVFAFVIARIVSYGLTQGIARSARWRVAALSAAVVLAFAVAEAKLLWYSFHDRDLSRSAQGLILSEKARLAGHRVFSDRLDRSAMFVAFLVGAEPRWSYDIRNFLQDSRPGDFYLHSGRRRHHYHRELTLVASNHGHRLFVRREPAGVSGTAREGPPRRSRERTRIVPPTPVVTP